MKQMSIPTAKRGGKIFFHPQNIGENRASKQKIPDSYSEGNGDFSLHPTCDYSAGFWSPPSAAVVVVVAAVVVVVAAVVVVATVVVAVAASSR